MSNIVKAAIDAGKRAAKNRSNQNVVGSHQIKGILINRDPPISAGWCGNDNCEHQNHKQRRAAQAATDTKAKR